MDCTAWTPDAVREMVVGIALIIGVVYVIAKWLTS